MLLTPFVCSAILTRRFQWLEIVALLAAVASFSIKDPLVVLARQRFVWKQSHVDTPVAIRWVVAELALMVVSGLGLIAFGPAIPFLVLSGGAGLFMMLAVYVHVRNRQRSAWFQVASAVALTSTSVSASLAVLGDVAPWCWWLWLLCALQAAGGIFTVHARLDARIAARKGTTPEKEGRRAALIALIVLLAAGCMFAVNRRFWIAGALLFAATGYFMELQRQRNPESLRMPLTTVGLQALALSLTYSAIVVIGLW